MKRLIVYSSISHLGWMVILFVISGSIGLVYFMIYVLVRLGVIYYFLGTRFVHIGQMFYSRRLVDLSLFCGFCISLFSLGGLPPFLGFYPR